MNHRDQVWINPITHVWTEIMNGTYEEMWDPKKFNSDAQLAKEVPIITAETINGKVRGRPQGSVNKKKEVVVTDAVAATTEAVAA